MADPLGGRVAALTGQPVTALRRLHGGDLSDIFAASLADGTTEVAKTGPLVGAEARMLTAIAATGCPAPQVLATGPGLMVMQHLPETGPADWAGLGRALRRLHATTGPHYGWDSDHAFGPVAIVNTPARDWPGFWARNRLLAAPAALPRPIAARLEHLAARLPGLLPHRPPAALLHGDLWAGNVLFGPGGPALIDPACYYGDAEVDLAMLHLFGRPGPGFDAAYGPLGDGWQARRAVYQLWPALVHLRLFGGGYRGMVENLLTAAGS